MQAVVKILKGTIYWSILIVFCYHNKNKEERHMKTTAMKYRDYIPYPGAASRRQQLHAFLDKCLLAASALGIVAMLMFLAVIV